MNCLLRFSLVLLLALISNGCSDDDGGPTGVAATGSILVTVQNSSSQVVSGATVHTLPRTGRYTTDVAGTVLIDDVEVGTYVVAATHPSFGTGDEPITVQSGNVQNVTIGLVDGVFPQPLVDITAPHQGQEFSFADSIALSAVISDDDSPETLSVQWTSDIDGGLSTVPADSNGKVEDTLSGLSLGTHQIALTATDSDGFVGVASVQVTVRSFPPKITWISPTPGVGYVPGEAIVFSATVSDHETGAEQLSAQWISDVDGILNDTAPTADGALEFSTSALSRGTHRITLTVTDADGNETTKGLTLENNLIPRVALHALDRDVSGIFLSWDPVDESDFDSYRIYRSTLKGGPFELVQILHDSQVSDYHDITVTPGVTYWYRMGLRTTAGMESDSNVEGIEAGITIELGTKVGAIMVDPTRPYLYALDQWQNSLLFVNLDTNQVEKRIYLGPTPVDLDINEGGTELFVAIFGSSQIAVIDLDTQEVARTWGRGVYDPESPGAYRLACFEDSQLVLVGKGESERLTVIDQLHGFGTVLVYAPLGPRYEPDLIASPDDHRIYAGAVERWEVVDGLLRLVDSGDGTVGSPLAVSGDGDYAVRGRQKLLTDDLSTVLGTYPEDIYLLNHDASIAVGVHNIYDGTTSDILERLPVFTAIMAFSADESVLYLCDTANTRLILFDLSTLEQ